MKAVPVVVVVLVVAGSALVAGQLFGGLLDVNSLGSGGFDFSGFDPTPFLRNRAFMRRQLACVTRTGPCDFIGRQLTVAVTEVLANNCRTCTPQQRSSANTVLNFISTNYPTQYRQLYNIYSRQRQAG